MVIDSEPNIRLMANGDVDFSAGRVKRADFLMFIANAMRIGRGAEPLEPELPKSYTGLPPLKPKTKRN